MTTVTKKIKSKNKYQSKSLKVGFFEYDKIVPKIKVNIDFWKFNLTIFIRLLALEKKFKVAENLKTLICFGLLINLTKGFFCAKFGLLNFLQTIFI